MGQIKKCLQIRKSRLSEIQFSVTNLIFFIDRCQNQFCWSGWAFLLLSVPFLRLPRITLLKKLRWIVNSQKLSEISRKNDHFGEKGVMIFFMEFNDCRAVRSFLTFGNISHDNIREENTFSFWNEHEAYSLPAFVTSLLHHFNDGYYEQKYVKNWQLGSRSGSFCLTAYN